MKGRMYQGLYCGHIIENMREGSLVVCSVPRVPCTTA